MRSFSYILGLLAILLVIWFVYSSGSQTTVPTNETSDMTGDGSIEMADLAAVGDFTGSGTAYRGFNETGFNHSVDAQLDAPEEGKFYEGWLVYQDLELEFFSTGKLELGEDDNYHLTYQQDEDASDYPKVVITLETEADGLDGNPEAHVLEGSF
ncbi:MAG: hypothetical protein U9M89_01880 [Patescibacteria group bacterium]|nr:hypothetical protein [Patescibacteria group bacterium]